VRRAGGLQGLPRQPDQGLSGRHGQLQVAFGAPLGPKVDARYEFWPQRKKEWPLLLHYATQVLAGTKASSCSNERAHSVSGRICTKLRGALLPNSIEQLTLAYYYITREVIAVLKQWGRKAGAILDAEDLEADARPEVAPRESSSTFYFPSRPPHSPPHHAPLLLLSPAQSNRKRGVGGVLLLALW